MKRASGPCRRCGELCQSLLKAVVPDFEEEKKKSICACLPFTQENLREMVRSQQIKSVQDVLEIYGNGIGCDVCKPALSYMMDVQNCGGT